MKYQSSVITQIDAQALQASIFSPYKCINTDPSELLPDPPKQAKKYSLRYSPKGRLKTDVSRSRGGSPVQTKLNPIRLPQNRIKMSPIERTYKVTDIVPDPFLNGKIQHERQQFYLSLGGKSQRVVAFFKEIERTEYRFLQLCQLKQYQQAEPILIKLLNYAIDLNLIDIFCISLKILGQFHLECNQLEEAFYYFNEMRRCSLAIGQHKLLIQALVKQSVCACRVNLYDHAVSFLKKALQYAWFYNFKNLELLAYDEMGKVFYKMGDSQKAKKYHHKFFSCNYEPKGSAIRLLAIESLILEGLSQSKPIRNIGNILLWMIKAPIKSLQEIPQFSPDPRSPSASIRKQFTGYMKYFSQFKEIKRAVFDVFQDSFFQTSITEPYFDDNQDWTLPDRDPKYLSLDIQRNRQLLEQGINFQSYFNPPQKITIQHTMSKRYPQQRQENSFSSVQELPRITQKLDKWYQGIAAESIRKNRNKDRVLHNRVQVRGINKQGDPMLKNMRVLFQQFFQKDLLQ